MSKVINLGATARLFGYHQTMIAPQVDIQLIAIVATSLPKSEDAIVIDSAFWSLQSLAGSANEKQMAYPLQKLGLFNEFVTSNWLRNVQPKIIRL